MISYLGIDVGGTKVAFRLASRDADPVQETFRWTPDADADTDLAELSRHARIVAGRAAEPIESIGIATPATVDSLGRVAAWPNRPTWMGVPLSRRLAESFPGIPVRVADDGDLAAVAEADAAGARDVVYVGVGTGVGGGIVCAGRSVPGTRRGSCELGHLVVDLDGPRCDCGRSGCVQAFASGPAILRHAGSLRGKDVSFDELHNAMAAGDAWAVDAIERASRALAAAIVGAAELVRADVAVVGGGFAMGLTGFVAAVGQRVAELGRPGHPPPEVRPALLGGLSSLYGAVLLARDAAVGG